MCSCLTLAHQDLNTRMKNFMQEVEQQVPVLSDSQAQLDTSKQTEG